MFLASFFIINHHYLLPLLLRPSSSSDFQFLLLEASLLSILPFRSFMATVGHNNLNAKLVSLSLSLFSIPFLFNFRWIRFLVWLILLNWISGSSRGYGYWKIQPRFAFCQGSIPWISGYFLSLLISLFNSLLGKFKCLRIIFGILEGNHV